MTTSTTSTTTPSAFLILHGWQNHRPPAHWQHQLADGLARLGHDVTYPQLPDPDDPSLGRWLAELADHLDGFGTGRAERVVVAHSLSAVLWLHAVAGKLPGTEAVDRVLLVAPPSASVLARYPQVAEFALPPLDGITLPGTTLLVAGDDDPYLPEGIRTAYGDPLGLNPVLLPGAAHLDLDAGYGSWPSVLEWCVDAGARIKVRGRG
ncbi:RBBP9/YdeN family alpha/beta hydrolase [Streptomyces antibioticus]|uniref:Hydrolase n=1 Tax=Streptomyces antibioticus TaxID=1890 RepID=A0AAE7CKJ1_STRAT|nr:alpha/beta hydrolase [Streptomyces antibioticus]OOQ52130.1 hydrolase [Streptomyces antibioticus]QIT44646.1 hydrolase [Streptomyces antibioticus]